MTYPIISADSEIQAHYEACRRQGTSHNLAEMFATGDTPQSNTDAEFWKGRWESDDQTTRLYRQRAEAQGVDTAGRSYIGQLARYPGDPRAFVGDRHDVQSICEQEGWGCQGAVKLSKDGRAQEEPVSGPGLADSLVESEAQEIVRKEPEKKRKIQQVRDEVRSKRTPHWSKGK